MANRKCYVVGGGKHNANFCRAEVVFERSKADFVIFTGGADISSKLYGMKRHPCTYPSPVRDEYEWLMAKACIKDNQPMVGLCRGAQILCAAAGGILVQDQCNKSFLHGMKTYDGHELIVNSLHHQACYPYGLDVAEYRILGWSKGVSAYHFGETDEEELINGKVKDNIEIEAIAFPKIKSLGFQYHPEMMMDRAWKSDCVNDTIKWTQKQLERLLQNDF